jgi:Response regulator receiver domain.
MASERIRGAGAVPEDRGTALLVVDDNEVNRDLLSRRLVSAGYAVAGAASGPEALAALEEGASTSSCST